MSVKKKKKRNAGPPKPMVRLSQCMIVKNEEKNIEKALSWAKGVVFEQIVVDTGSTDKTVEIAEKMGAKVYHFEWIDDFSAAKNFAIEQATGNWIAFLDADEYFSPEDAKKIFAFAKGIQSDPELRENYHAINSPMAHVDDEGKPFAVFDQERVFRSFVRYNGKIHEQINVAKENIARAENMMIIHTGYAKSAYQETGKANRNVEMLRSEIKNKPQDYNLKAYLADSLKNNSDAESIAEADAMFYEVINTDQHVFPALKKKAYSNFIEEYIKIPEKLSECERLCRKALVDFPGDIDLEYNLGYVLNRKGDYHSAWDILKVCEEKLIGASIGDESMVVAVKPMLLFFQLAVAAQELGNISGTIRYASMVLAEDKSQTTVLQPYIATLLKNGASEDDVISLLEKLYDFSNPKDILLIARAAKDCGAIDFARRLAEMIKNNA